MKKRLFIILFFLITLSIYAHPHIFFSYRYTFNVGENKINGMRVEWIFDEIFTDNMLWDFDIDQNDKFDKSETKSLKETTFLHLIEYNFFQLIRQGKKVFNIERIENFKVYLEKGHLVYSFYIPLDFLPVGKTSFATCDMTFFCAVEFDKKQPVSFSDKEETLKYFMKENKNNPVFYNPTDSATTNSFYEKWEPGLETYYPIEAVVGNE